MTCYRETSSARRMINSSPTLPRGILLLVAMSMAASSQSLRVSGAKPPNTSPSLCFPSCGPLGYCVPDRSVCGSDDNADENCATYTCECEPGFTGRDCSLRSPDVCHVHASPEMAELHVDKCLNGGTCDEVKSEGGHVWAICNCTKAFGASGLSVENLDCEFFVTDVCETGTNDSDHAYCYNGGKCLARIGALEPHPGCNCSGTGFAGRHCQFPQESVPIEEEVFVATGKDIIADYEPESKATTTPTKETSSTTIVMVALTFLGLTVFMYRVVQSRARRAAMVKGQVELEMSCSSDNDEFFDATPNGFRSAVVGGNNQIC